MLFSGNEIGPFRGLEESIIAHVTDPEKRSDVYAWYSLFGTAGGAFGILTCGWVTHYMRVSLQLDVVDVYRGVFYGYAVLGLAKLVAALVLSSAVEIHHEPQQPESAASNDEETPLIPDLNPQQATSQAAPTKQLRARISRESIPIVVCLCALFGLDSFASGLAPL